MPSIHFICRDRLNLHRVSDDGEYESGNWGVTAADAEKLIGGMIYLHNTKSERSYFGGRIKMARPVVTDDARSVRFVFRIEPLQEAREVRWTGADHGMAWTSGVVED
ncbi:hypothetical protein [Vitiosangium sp. GDMCC 1.1324]|uniref:hypothetical protein n=1 Tax=Vitiosangium sp. (strain GDMCC 1.1324) TaxID=2138576 RepID=UPI000D3C5D10|nr:hypothetical protein [Vitiosangium sp. GDMCC 1.1324]PTL79835.1 hypothetical protein DAT35_30820 [Vitiosangium sp. GDMCC 1.1324]